MKKETPVFHKTTFDNIPEEKRVMILETAIAEFSSKGFENANINVVAKMAGVSVGSLYKYFSTKVDLFLTCVNYCVGFLEEALGAIISRDEDILIKLERIIRTAMKFSREHSEMIELYNEFTTERNAELGARLAERMETITADAYKQAIIQAQVSGEIRTDIDPGMAAWLVDNMLMTIQFSYACTYYAERYKIYAGSDIFEKEEYAIQNILRFTKAALKPTF